MEDNEFLKEQINELKEEIRLNNNVDYIDEADKQEQILKEARREFLGKLAGVRPESIRIDKVSLIYPTERKKLSQQEIDYIVRGVRGLGSR